LVYGHAATAVARRDIYIHIRYSDIKVTIEIEVSGVYVATKSV
jgi:hypothetical protein